MKALLSQPMQDVDQKIVREAYSAFTDNATEVYHQPACKVKSSSDLDFTPSSKFYVMKASIDFPKTARGNDSDVKAGFRILESDSESTSIYYRKSSSRCHWFDAIAN